MQHRLACFCADQGLGGGLPPAPSCRSLLPPGGLAGRASSTKGTYRSVLRSLGGSGGPGGPRLLAALPPKRPTAPKKEPSFCPSPPLSARGRGDHRRSPSWPLASGQGSGQVNWPPPSATTSARAEEGWRAGGRRAGRPRQRPVRQNPCPASKTRGAGLSFLPRRGRPGLQELRQQLLLRVSGRPGWPEAFFSGVAVPVSSATTWRRGHLCGNCFYGRHRRSRVAAALRPPRPGGTWLQGGAAGEAAPTHEPRGPGPGFQLSAD